MAETTSLLNGRTGNRTTSSNLVLTATKQGDDRKGHPLIHIYQVSLLLQFGDGNALEPGIAYEGLEFLRLLLAFES